MKPKLPEKGTVSLITIEHIQNGFMIGMPSDDGMTNSKHYRGTINGVVKIIEHLWGVKYIIANEQENLSNIFVEKPQKVITKAKQCKHKSS